MGFHQTLKHSCFKGYYQESENNTQNGGEKNLCKFHIYDNGLSSRTRSDQHSMGYSFIVTSIFKDFTMLFRSVLYVYFSLVSLGLEWKSIS